MDRSRIYRGASTQGERPDWGPLLNAVGEEVTGHFMWMFEVVLTNGTALQAYKHIDTRRYIHLASNGDAFVYESSDRYRRMPAVDVLGAVFAPLAGLAGVTERQVRASWAAVERIRRSE